MSNVANTILAQLGTRAAMMMGMKNPIATESGVRFSIGANASKISKIQIDLDPSDTYTIRFYSGRAESFKFCAKTGEMKTIGGYVERATVSDVYVDSMRRVIESNTGLYLSALKPTMKHGDRIEIDGETWVIVAVGVTEGECTYVHVKHTTKGTTQRNGFCPMQAGVWYNPKTKKIER